MISEATLYFCSADDLRAATTAVAGRPLAFRMTMAAVRAGCRRVWLPAALRPGLEKAIAASASARAAVAWLDPGAPREDIPLLLLPATALVPPGALVALLAAGCPAVLAVSRERSVPVATLPPDATRRLWEGIAGGKALRDALEGVLADARVTVVGGGWCVRVAKAGEAAAAEDALYAELGSPIDTRLDRTFHRRLSRPVSRLAVAWGLTPNHVTLASLVVGLAAAWCFWEATVAWALAGLVLYAAAVVLDHADGEVARLTFTESPFGERLDVLVDTVVHVLLMLALGATAQRAAGSGGVAAVIAAVGVAVSAMVTRTSPATPGRAGAVAALGNRDGYYVMLVLFIAALAALPAALPMAMVVIAAGCHAFWLGWLAYVPRER